MKRLLTALMILLVVVVAGLSALILLVNPNDFRSWMVQQVAARSGYQLDLDGPLRWHVWPQLSILSGRMTLTAPGAVQPVVTAENMRLDVALFPLLSHQLSVSQVFIKDAVVQLTPDSQPRPSASAPVAPPGSRPTAGASRGWSFDIEKLEIVDSVLVFQRPNQEQITVRNLNLEMGQSGQKAHIELSSRINRDQRDLSFSLEGDLDRSDYPDRLTAQISALDYQVQGTGLPPEGIKGSAALEAEWQAAGSQPEKLSLNLSRFTANDSDLRGKVALTSGAVPDLTLSLQADKLNLDNLLIREADSGAGSEAASVPPRPVIADHQGADYPLLRNSAAAVSLTADNLTWRGLQLTGLQARLNNRQGLLSADQFEAHLGQGTLALPGSLDVRQPQAQYSIQPRLSNIDMARVLTAFDYPAVISGQLTFTGSLSGNVLSAADFRQHWQGRGQLNLTQARLQGMNFQQLIQQAVSRSANGVDLLENDDNATALDSLGASVRLDAGILQIQALSGESRAVALTGGGTLNLVRQVCDMAFDINIRGGWQGSNSRLIGLLKNTAIPLRIYGPWQALNYSLPVDQVLRDLLQNGVRQRVNQWLNDNPGRKDEKDIRQLINDI